jgi:regulator of protease activity HflC (stomatin/prohibitin superfamily)
MKDVRLIENFSEFEEVYGLFESGEMPDDSVLNEGLLSGIMTFFSRVFGGRINEIDRIIRKYEKNESGYWEKWANANHEYNKAAVLRDESEDKVDRRKHIEMMERSRALARQTTKTRDQVNDALERQAVLLIRNNRRLRNYWEIQKAKVDEKVAQKSHTSLKKLVDEDTLEELYDRVKDTRNALKKKESQIPKGTMTVEFGKYPDLSDRSEKVPMRKFGIYDKSDFVFAKDELWNERVSLMPKENLEELVDDVNRAISDVEETTAAEMQNYKQALDKAEDEEERKRITADMERAKKYAEEDLDMLKGRLGELGAEAPETTETPEADPADEFGGLASSVSKTLGDIGDAELEFVLSDLRAILDMMPAEDKDGKKMKVRVDQLSDFATDVYEYRQKNGIRGESTKNQVEELYKAFKKEFPK